MRVAVHGKQVGLAQIPDPAEDEVEAGPALQHHVVYRHRQVAGLRIDVPGLLVERQVETGVVAAVGLRGQGEGERQRDQNNQE